MAVTIHSLVYKAQFNATEFTKGAVATRSELAHAKRIMAETRTDTERLGLEIDKAGNLFRKGAIDVDTYARKMDLLKKEMLDVAKASAMGGLGGITGGDM